MINRVLIVGLGSIGKRHLRLARMLLPEAEIMVLRHQMTNEIPELANGCLFSLDQAIQFRPQIAIISNPATKHLEIALPLAAIGVHLLVEKPVADSITGVDLLIETCRKNAVVLMLAYNLRFVKSLQKFKGLIDEGTIGKILSIRCEVGQYLPSWRPDTDYRKSVSSRKESGGGVLLELSHEIDYLRWIFGEIKWVIASLSRQSGLEIDVEDTAHLILGFTSNDEGHMLRGSLNMDFIRHDTTRVCTAIGERGSLKWDAVTGRITVLEEGAQEWRVLFAHTEGKDDCYRSEWIHFFDCVKNNKPPMITGEDGLRVMQIIEAARESSQKCCRINLKA